MTVKNRGPIPMPSVEDASADSPVYRYWGKTKPPKNATVLCAVNPRVSNDSTKATIRIYGPIDPWGGFWGVSSKEVATALDGLEDSVTEIIVRINTPGGSCFEGLAILNLLRAHPAKVTAVVDGVAASAGSFIAAGCDVTVMSPGTQMMVHDPWSSAWGCNSAEMRKVADTLDKIADSMADLYAEVAGGKAADWRAVMVEETWYTAKEAVEAGLADMVGVVADAGETSTAGDDTEDPILEDDADVADLFDLSIYTHAGRDNAPAPAALRHTKPPTASADGFTTTQEGSPAVAFSDEQVTNMRQKLGVAEDADEATILAALDEALEERSEPQTAATAEVPEGHVVIPEAQLKDLQAGAALAVSTAKKLHDEERNRFLTENRTKFVPASRAAWEKEYDRDPVAVRAHFATAPVIVPTEALGHDGQPETSDDDATYAALFGDEKIGA